MWGLRIWSLFCYAVLSVHSSFVIILMGEKSWLLYFNCLPDVAVSVQWFFLTVSLLDGLQRLVVVFPAHTHFLRFTGRILIVERMYLVYLAL